MINILKKFNLDNLERVYLFFIFGASIKDSLKEFWRNKSYV